MTGDLRILVIDDELDDTALLTRHLRRSGFTGEIQAITLVSEVEPLLAEPWDALISDFRLAGATALDVLALAAQRCPDVPVIVVSGVIDEEGAAAAFRAGARDFVSKQRLDRLGPAISREVDAAIERRAAQAVAAELSLSQAQVSVMLGRIPGAIWIVDRDLQFVTATGGLIAQLYPGLGELAGQPISVVPGLSAATIAAHHTALAGHAVTYEVDVAGHLVNIRLEPLLAADGTAEGIVGFAHEVTAERERERRTDELKTVVDALVDAVFVVDIDGVIRYANGVSARLFGAPDEGLDGRSIADLLEGESSARLMQALDRTLHLEDATSIHVVATSAPGESVDLELTLSPVIRSGTIVSGIAVVARDIGDRMRHEAELVEAQKIEAIGQLAGGVAHDLNNILLAVRGFTSLLMDDLAATPAMADLAEIDDAANRAALLVSRLLAFGRRQVLQPTLVDLSEAIPRIAPLLRSAAGGTVDIELDLVAAPMTVEIDPSQLDQLLINLVVNARDAMPDGGTLRITTAFRRAFGDAERAVLSVVDNGTGIDPAIRDRIFDPFFTTKADRGGNGLGLSVVHGVVAQSGGTIEVESPAGVGTAFHIILPVVGGRAASAEPTRLEPERESGVVLVIEDDVTARTLIGRLVLRMGYQVITADSGADALALLAAGPSPAFVVCGLVMRGLDGAALIAKIRSLAPAAGVVATSGSVDRSAQGNLPPGTCFLAKPFGRRELDLALQTARRDVSGR